MNKFKINIDSGAKRIIEILKHNNFESYVVGGCVRDSLLKRTPGDWDLTTNALPQEVMDIFKNLGYKVIPTGIKHGTVTILIDKNSYEITTYRIDGEYENNRTPKEVEFTKSLKEDLKRRDFTINAMAYNDINGLIDYFNGVEDLNNKIIRSVGNAEKRFKEDALRMMRAVRFMAQLEFEIEASTLEALRSLSENIGYISVERVREEFNKLILSNVYYINELKDTGLLHYFLKIHMNNYEFIKELNYEDFIKKSSVSINYIKENYGEVSLELLLTILLYNLERQNLSQINISEEILRIMKYDKKFILKVKLFMKFMEKEILNNNKDIKYVLKDIGEENLREVLKLKKACLLNETEDYRRIKEYELNEILDKLESILELKECYVIKDLKVKGKDLIELGISPGKHIGEILEYLLCKVIEDNNFNNKEKLIKTVEKNLQRQNIN